MIQQAVTVLDRVDRFVRFSRAVIRNEGIAMYLLDLWAFLTVRNPVVRALMARSRTVTETSFALFRATTTRYYRLVAAVGRARITDADPYKIVYVDPDRIDTQLEYGEDGPRITKRHGRVLGGDWDHETMPFTKKDRFVRWARFDRSPRIDPEEPITELYFEIETDGYKAQSEVLEAEFSRVVEESDGALHPRLNEIGVNVGRDGTLIWRCYGQHRLILAKLLDVDRVPVQILVRHEQWQRLRDEIRNGEPIPDRVSGHPDLRDLHYRGD